MDVKLNILIAYPYMTPPIIKGLTEIGPHLRFVLDSGAFTAWKLNRPIKLDSYCKFIEELPIKPWRYFALDVVGDPHATMRNYEVMLARGFNPVPIFTRGEDPKVLDDYYKTSDVIGIGGLVGTPNNRGFVRGIMQHAKKRHVHWLGFTNFDFIKYYQPYMCDSSAWEASARYGSLRLYMGNGKLLTIEKSQFSSAPKKEVLDRIKYLGVDPYKLATLDNWHGGPSISRTIGARSAVAMSVDVERHIKTKIFNALATHQALELMTQGFYYLYGRSAL
jgi:hypothetical protein